MPALPWVESFTEAEARRLSPYVSNLDRPVFALKNLPEVVKGALFARYSRSPKSLRRLLLDEFLPKSAEATEAEETDAAAKNRAEALYDRVFLDFGDDSVAQLGGVHLACEGVSNLLSKQLEWGRLASYLEQSTRYIPYTDKPGGRFRYHTPEELAESPLKARYEAVQEAAFERYGRLLEAMRVWYRSQIPPEGEPDRAYEAAIAAKALDAVRGLLPAATRSNLGIYASGQAYENLLIRLRADSSLEAQRYAQMMLEELRQVIPAFIRRVDLPDRGAETSAYLAKCRAQSRAIASRLLSDAPEIPKKDRSQENRVCLLDFDPEGETKLLAAVLSEHGAVDEASALDRVATLSDPEKDALFAAYLGDRQNRRHRPGRAFERTDYRFEIVGDYGAFRDLQRHRLLSLTWQPLSPQLGYQAHEDLIRAGFEADLTAAMTAGAALYEALHEAGFEAAAPYALPMAYRIRYHMQMNAREAMHLIELRSQIQGHLGYRRIACAMHEAIERVHPRIGKAMAFVFHGEVQLERMEAERRLDAKRQERA